jgi:hypothetical protein
MKLEISIDDFMKIIFSFSSYDENFVYYGNKYT